MGEDNKSDAPEDFTSKLQAPAGKEEQTSANEVTEGAAVTGAAGESPATAQNEPATEALPCAADGQKEATVAAEAGCADASTPTEAAIEEPKASCDAEQNVPQ